jgi:predicted  nucleic acid-binding Zn-ribbon protein
MARPDLATVNPVLKPLGYEGGRANGNAIETQDRVNDQATKINFGRAVARSASDKTCKLMTAASDVPLGFAARHAVLDVEDASNEWAYDQYDSVTIVKKGWYFAIPLENVTEGDAVVVVAGQAGKFGSGSATVADTSVAEAVEGNTGNGVMTLDATTPLLAGAQSGVYTATATAAATDSGTFRVTDPNGSVLGDVAVGATFANQIKFVIADGSTDFIVGDKFTVTVAIDVGRVAFGNSTWETTTLANQIGIMRVDM